MGNIETAPVDVNATMYLAKPELASSKLGYVKVRLLYRTAEPKHAMNCVTLKQFGIQPPYCEDLCILMPRHKVFTILEVYLPVFEHLQSCSLISRTAQLQAFEILVEDNLTLAYIV